MHRTTFSIFAVLMAAYVAAHLILKPGAQDAAQGTAPRAKENR